MESDEVEQLTVWLKEDFGRDGDRMKRYCMSPEAGRPLYLSHVEAACKTFDVTIANPGVAADLRAGYVYLTAMYFCVDALADGHHTLSKSDCEYEEVARDVPVLQATALRRLSRLISTHQPTNLAQFLELYHRTIHENWRALYEERRWCSTPVTPFDPDKEFFHLWARSNSFLLLFQLVSVIAAAPLPHRIEELIKRCLYLSQRGDDVGDWREDFRAKIYTPFIRKCFSRRQGISAEDDLEEVVYLDGMLEAELAEIIREFDDVDASLPVGAFEPVRVLLRAQRARARTMLAVFVSEKMSHGLTYGA